MTTTDLETMMSARRADLTASPTAAADTSAPAEVIGPVDGATGEILPVAASATAPAGPVVPADPEPQFPMIPPKVLGGLPYARSYMKLAQTIHQTEMVPKDFRGRPDAIMAAMMYGYELGLGPMQALSGINVIQGRPSMSAELMRALITEAGHMIILRQDNEVATIRTRRKDWPAEEPAVEFTWTIADAQRAGLVEWHEKWTKTEQGRNKKLTWNPHSDVPPPSWVAESNLQRSDAWHNYTRAMLGARVTSEAARALYADVLAGMSYTPEEIREFNGGVAEAPLEQEVAQSPSPPSDAVGQPAEPTPPEPEATAQPTAEPPAPVTEKPKRARGAKEAAPSPAAEAQPVFAPPAPAPASASPDSEAVQPDLEGTEPAEPPAPAEPGEKAMEAELRTSLSAILSNLPTVQQPLCRGFLAQHFPGKKAVDLNATELTLAINIAGGWPQSADKYPPNMADEHPF